MLFISPEKLFLFLRYLNFCPDFFGHVGNGLGRGAKVNFKNYYVINWKTDTSNIHTAQYLKKKRQSDKEI